MAEDKAPPNVSAIPGALRTRLSLGAFYQKVVMVEKFPIVSSARVSDVALLEAAWILRNMLEHRPALFAVMAEHKVKLAVMAWNEFTTDVPEHAHLKPRIYWDRRARGLGATPSVPTVSCAEENLLCLEGDPYSTENILIHEFAHAIHETGMNHIDTTFDSRLSTAFQSATNRSLWKGTYAASNRQEYWAEGVQSWFDNNRENDALHNHINTRSELKPYDPALAALCAEVFGERAWRYKKPAERPANERAHFDAFDRSAAPRFRWREEPVGPAPRVEIHTALGVAEIELHTSKAPVTVTNFLRYVQAGFYNGGVFFRSVKAGNQPTNDIKIQVLQGSADPARESDYFPAIALERTRDTGLKHRDGTVSMARAEPDTAQHHFFVCIGDQPELDFGGRRNPDGQGFAAFATVVRGMDVIRKIHDLPTKGQLLNEPMKIQRMIRVE